MFIEKIIGKFKFFNFNNIGNKTTINNYQLVIKENLKDNLLTCFSHKETYTREEIAEKIIKIL